MKRFCLYILYIIGLATTASAQEFFNLTANEVKIDSVLPYFTHQIELGVNYADSVYEVAIEYPEFIDMSPSDVERYEALSSDTLLPEMPTVYQYVAVERKRGTLCLSFLPLVKREGRYQKLVSFKLNITARAISTVTQPRRAEAVSAADRYAAHSVLASGRWVKISIPHTGIYHLSNDVISRAGFSDPSKVKIYGYGGALQPEELTGDYLIATDDLKEVPTCMVNGRRLFFGTGTVGWAKADDRVRVRNNYSVNAYYFLTENDGAPKTVDQETFLKTARLDPYSYHSHVEPEEFSWYNSGRNLYAKTPLSMQTASSYTLYASSERGTITVAMSYDGYCDATVALNGTPIGTISVNATTVAQGVSYFRSSTYSSVASYNWDFTTNALKVGENTITITQTSNSSTKMRLDYLTLTSTQPTGYDLSSNQIAEPEVVGEIANQDHHADSPVDMVIIIPSSRKLQGEAERLKQMHETRDGMRVRLIAADELYNEFSSGTPDANAYRRYLKMLYDRAATEDDMPRYLLLFGDAAWDNRMLIADWKNMSPEDFLLCYESENSFSNVYSYVCDDFFCLLDDEEGIENYLGKPDVAVGRIPARTEAEAKVAVDKIIGYVENDLAGAWQNLICIMGDDGDSNQHMQAADEIARQVQQQFPAYNIKKVYWDAYTRETTSTGNGYPSVTRMLKQQMRDGALIMNYNGHGGPYSISHEQVLVLSDFGEETSMRLPLWVTASCDILPFDRQTDNIGEKAIFNKKGGAVAFFGTPRTVFMDKNRLINLAFMSYVLATDEKGRRISIGEAVRLAKNKLVDDRTDRTVNKLNYALLGDPALVLAAPTLKATIDKINDQPVNGSMQQLKAGQLVTVEGHIEGQNSFNGVGTVIVRDIEEDVVCKMNDSTTPFTYKDRLSTIYAGSDSVSNGQFKFTFIVPYDISYSDESGQMLVYAVSTDKQKEAHGVEQNFSMNGTAEGTNSGMGPSVYCYLNSRSFVDGGTVNSTPYFYAELTDNDGINAAGSGIGHDIELIIDGDMSQTYVLNSYFQYNFGDYRSGTIGYSIPELSAGPHKLMLRAWDILNNSSTTELSFVVDPQQTPELVNIICVRNPASTNTRFLITHNRIGSQIDVVLEIYDTSGRILWRRSETGMPSDQTYTIDWDLTTNGHRLHTGVYLYRVLISSNGSSEATAAQKLIIIGNN